MATDANSTTALTRIPRPITPGRACEVLRLCRDCSAGIREQAGHHAAEVAKPLHGLATAIERVAADWAAEHGQATDLAKNPTIEAAAALAFEPWEHTPDEWVPPSNTEWAALANPYLVVIRMAWMTLYKTKPEVMTIVEEIDDDAGRQLMNSFVTTINFFKGVLAILENAEARILCAGSAVIAREEAAEAQP